MSKARASLIDRPKKWAYLVAVGPASIAAGLLALALVVAGAPGGPEALILWFVLNAAAVPAVLVGIWLDVRVVERETGVGQRAWLWNLLALFVAPLIGTVYLWSRRRYFREPMA